MSDKKAYAARERRREDFFKLGKKKKKKRGANSIVIKPTPFAETVDSGRLQKIVAYLQAHNLHEKAEQAMLSKSIIDIQEWENYIFTHQRIEERKKKERDSSKEQPQIMSGETGDIEPNLAKLQESVRVALDTEEFSQGLQNLQIHTKEIEKFLHDKWAEITSTKRQFGLSPEQAYEVVVSVKPFIQLGIHSLIFQQKGFIPPAVGVDISMQYGIVFRCSLDEKGNLKTFPKLNTVIPYNCHLLLRLAVIMYYADLVIPRDKIQSHHKNKDNKTGPQETKTQISYIEATKRIPRNSSPMEQSVHSYSHALSHSTFVDPFRRRLPNGQKPSFMKVIEADQFGINLQGAGFPDVQYTFVKAHIRGDGDEIRNYTYKQEYSAVKTFETILSVFGFF